MSLAITADTLDDLMRNAIKSVLSEGTRILPTKGEAFDLTGVRLELRNPLARLSRTETRGRLFSCLGELCWYLAGTNDLDYISYYIRRYKDYGEHGYVHGGYGPRIRGAGNSNQIDHIINRLRGMPHSRKAVIQIFDRQDLAEPHLDVPCTCTLQFVIRNGYLNLVTYMRSNDLYLGLPHDVFSFTMIQELIARSLHVKLGTYIHMVGSLHLYMEDCEKAKAFLNEGWQSMTAMPSMPPGDQWANVTDLLNIESYLRGGNEPLDMPVMSEEYWADLSRILAIYALGKNNRLVELQSLHSQVYTDAYDIFVADRFYNVTSF